MARKKSKGQLNISFPKFKDERIYKLFGLFSIFIALYLFISFTSYLFTWHIDQSNVLEHSVSFLYEGEIGAANWLGRLGAIVSNMFFYWGFGLPSFIFVFVFGKLGINTIRERPFNENVSMIWNGFILLLFLSIFFHFIFQSSSFPYGGAFGKATTTWLLKFIGTIGLVALLMFTGFTAFIWTNNPNFNELTFEKLLSNTRFFFDDLFSGNFLGKKKKRRSRVASKRETSNSGALLPRNSGALITKSSHFSADLELSASEAGSAAPVVADESSEVKKGQLAFDLAKKKREKPQTLRSGEAEMEISAPTPFVPEEDEPKSEPATTLTSDYAETTLEIQTDNKLHTEPYDPTLDLSHYEHPVTSLLEDYNADNFEIDRQELEQNKDQIIETLLNYKIEIVKIKATIGPTVTLYEIVPAPGVRISKIKNLEDDIALSLSAMGIRIIAPIPGKGTIGIEVANKKTQIVSLKELLQSDKYKRAKMDLPIALGKTIQNEVFVADLAKMPHLLIAGATGQGKSVGINVILMSLLYKKHPSQIKLVLIDPKKVELFPYSKIENHFLAYLPGLDEPIVTDVTKVVHTLNSLMIEMDTRYDLLKKAHARNIREYNEKFIARRLNPNKGHKFMPFIILVVDEFADLIMTAGKEVELPIGRLAQLSRAVGIHLIIATQRPSVNIITGVIKANFPARIAFKVTARVDSRTILDTGGADRLIGRGDMLLSYGSDLVRLQCAFVDTPEVEKVIDFIGSQRGYATPFFLPEFHGDDDDSTKPGAVNTKDLDDNFEDAARLIVQNQHGSTSMIQRRLKLGYNRAGRIMDQLEALGIVGPSLGSKAREVLIYDEIELERYLEDIRTRK
ncbi:DNA translocase FtsK [Saprospiraceae bacterium]|nr:DNA translocase FtsK [Saprospiraceae bacterium]MDB4539735.1 DNA translocase FtsK [Saprospiraceae bacterium]